MPRIPFTYPSSKGPLSLDYSFILQHPIQSIREVTIYEWKPVVGDKGLMKLMMMEAKTVSHEYRL
jgi:hypothetical protein